MPKPHIPAEGRAGGKSPDRRAMATPMSEIILAL
jgi:hypothetical protein